MSAERPFGVVPEPQWEPARVAFLAALEARLGRPYIWGAEGPDAYDCSGLVCTCLVAAGLRQHGYRVSAEGLRRHHRAAHAADAIVGDLIYYGSITATHIGVLLDGGRAVSASRGGPRCRSLADAARRQAMVRVHRAAYRRDVLGYGRLI